MRRQVTTSFRQTEVYFERKVREQERLGSPCLPQPPKEHSSKAEQTKEKRGEAGGRLHFLVGTADACSTKLLNISLVNSTNAAFHSLSQRNSIYVTRTHTQKGLYSFAHSNHLQNQGDLNAHEVLHGSRYRLEFGTAA